MKVLIDTNILIDWISHRDKFWENSKKIISLCSGSVINGCIAAHSITNIFYILRHKTDFEKRVRIYKDLSDIFFIIPLDAEKIKNAVNNAGFADIEDCIQAECAKEFNADFIITRNVRDFTNSEIKAIEPQEFLKILKNYNIT